LGEGQCLGGCQEGHRGHARPRIYKSKWRGQHQGAVSGRRSAERGHGSSHGRGSTGAKALTEGAAPTGNTAEARTEEGEAGPAEAATTRKSGSRRSLPIAFKWFFSSLSEYFCSTQMHRLNSKTSRYVIFFSWISFAIQIYFVYLIFRIK
jgi:hypothetical protein